jgi:hypothetical protein
VANLYGVASPTPFPGFAQLIGGANIACPAGVETNIFQINPPVIVSPGMYYPWAYGVVNWVVGATGITFLTINFRINNGADLTQITLPQTGWGANVLASSAYFMPITSTVQSNPTSALPWQVSVTPATGSLTMQIGGSYLFAQWLRAPDQ